MRLDQCPHVILPQFNGEGRIFLELPFVKIDSLSIKSAFKFENHQKFIAGGYCHWLIPYMLAFRTGT